MMPGFILCLLGFGFGLLPLAVAESWTNQAGRVVEGRIEAVDGATLTLLRTNGVRMKIPLNALAAADQKRALAGVGKTIAPNFVQTAYQDAYAVLEQFDRLTSESRTADAAKKARRLAVAIFDARLKPRAAELKAADIQAEVQRLRLILHGDG